MIYQYIKDTGYPPTFEEMREKIGVSSNQSVMDLLKQLRDKSFIKRAEGEARSITILPLGYKILGKPPLVAFLGATSAGAPLEAVAIAGEWQTLPSFMDKLETLKGEVSILKISGDSMINAGIEDGDLVLVKSAKEFVSTDIVLAQIGGESTIKRFMSDDKPPYVYLKPENPKYENILFRDGMELKGKVISILKNGYWKSI